MKKQILIPIYIVMFGMIMWGFIIPKGITAAIKNNAWSLNFVKTFFANPECLNQLPSPPPSHARAGIYLVNQALLQEDNGAALHYITPLIVTNDPFILGIYAQVLYQQKEYELAISTWESIGDTQSLWRIAGELTNIHRLDLRAAAGRSLYNIDPESYVSYYADSLLNISEYQIVISLMTDTINRYPNSENRENWKIILSKAYYDQGTAYLNNRQWAEAETQFFLAINANSKMWQAWKRLGYLYYQRDKDAKKAIECFEKVMEIAPENGEGYLDIGEIYIKEKQISRAIEWFADVGKRYPDKPRFQINYANLLRDYSNLELSIATYLAVIDQLPEEASVYYELTKAYLMDEQTEEALKTIQVAIKLRNDVPAYHILGAQIYEQEGLLQEALDAYRKALELDPENNAATDAIVRLSGGD